MRLAVTVDVVSGEETVDVTIANIAKGGDGVGRTDDGKVIFVRGGIPGERVRAQIRSRSKSYANGDAIAVIDASKSRVKPACETWHRGCGGCDFMHVDPATQPDLKARIVTDALERIAGIHGVEVVRSTLPDRNYRTTVRTSVRGGRAGFRRVRSHDPVAVTECLVAHPLVEEILVEGRFGGASEVMVRAGANTGERLVLVTPSSDGTSVPDDVLVVGADELDDRDDAFVHEVVVGRSWQISAGSFFQTGPVGAEALVAAVAGAVDRHSSETASIIDLYAGVGLLSASGGGRPVVAAVEASSSACRDARVNLAESAAVWPGRVEHWAPRPAGTVIADPGRNGLGSAGVRAIARTGADAVVLVSCDAASLARDAGLLTERGYSVVGLELVDMFPNTSHTESVAAFVSDSPTS